MPCATRGRHRVSTSGQVEANEINEISKQLKVKIVTRFGKLAQLCEIMKQEGLPGNEVRHDYSKRTHKQMSKKN
jgi:hypothetical protein